MSFEELFRGYWWLIFPIFGMAMAILGMIQSERRTDRVMDLIRSYADQGKEPPPELLRMAAQSMDEDAQGGRQSREHSSLWTFIVFAALTAGFGVGYYMIRAEDWAWAFLLVAVVMGVMALGALLILVLGRK
ncbi:MAG: hypothetical protein AB7O98_01015 [Hyphomonadaceae bacterium]